MQENLLDSHRRIASSEEIALMYGACSLVSVTLVQRHVL